MPDLHDGAGDDHAREEAVKRAPQQHPIARANALASMAGRDALALIVDVRDPRPEGAVHQLWRWLVKQGAAR